MVFDFCKNNHKPGDSRAVIFLLLSFQSWKKIYPLGWKVISILTGISKTHKAIQPIFAKKYGNFKRVQP